MAKEIVALSADEKKLFIEIARVMSAYEEDVAKKWEALVKVRIGLKKSDRAIKNFREAVWLFLTSLSDGEFDAYFKRIEEKGADFAKTKEQYENLILSFYLYEEATFRFLQEYFAGRIHIVLTSLDYLYHNVIAILARAYFRELERDREKFITILAHDLRNTLMGIMGFSNIIIEDIQKGQMSKEEEMTFLTAINSNAKRMQNLIDSMLNYGKLKSGKYEPNITDFDLLEVIRNVALALLPEANKYNVSIRINGHDWSDMSAQPSIMISADKGLIIRAVGNYISNAVKYAKKVVSLSVEQREEDILILVTDDGPGISPSDINLIFEDYYQAKGGKPGTGLGLPSVRMIAGLHSGKAWVESNLGAGSTFFLRLPKKVQR